MGFPDFLTATNTCSSSVFFVVVPFLCLIKHHQLEWIFIPQQGKQTSYNEMQNDLLNIVLRSDSNVPTDRGAESPDLSGSLFTTEGFGPFWVTVTSAWPSSCRAKVTWWRDTRQSVMPVTTPRPTQTGLEPIKMSGHAGCVSKLLKKKTFVISLSHLSSLGHSGPVNLLDRKGLLLLELAKLPLFFIYYRRHVATLKSYSVKAALSDLWDVKKCAQYTSRVKWTP